MKLRSVTLILMYFMSLDLTRILTVQFNGENQGFEEYLETISPEANASAA